MTKPTLYIYRGIPGSGKTTEAIRQVNASIDTVRVNRDEIRHQTHNKFWGVDENFITAIEHASIEAALKAGKSVIDDATNLRAQNVRKLVNIAVKHGANVEYVDFEISLDEAIARDAKRDRVVSEPVIRDFYNRFVRKGKLVPAPQVPEPIIFEPYVEKKGLPHAIIVDIDGTLAHMTGRSPYDTSRYHEDDFDFTIAGIVYGYMESGGYVILLSGRDETYMDVTEKWLEKFGFVEYDHFYMRPAGDQRNDAIVKNELFEQHIAGKYNIDFVLDDRNRVVDMWRAKGLKCLQVAEGDF